MLLKTFCHLYLCAIGIIWIIFACVWLYSHSKSYGLITSCKAHLFPLRYKTRPSQPGTALPSSSLSSCNAFLAGRTLLNEDAAHIQTIKNTSGASWQGSNHCRVLWKRFHITVLVTAQECKLTESYKPQIGESCFQTPNMLIVQWWLFEESLSLRRLDVLIDRINFSHFSNRERAINKI